MVKLTLKQCEYFVAVAQEGGIAQAARILNISQPAVSQAIEKLEDICGLQLLLRHHARGTELTPQGRAFLVSAGKLLETARQTELHAEAIAANQAGTLRLGCFHTLAPYHLAGLIREHQREHPDIHIIPSELLQDELIARVQQGELDLALTYDMSLSTEQLRVERLQELTPFVLLGKHHALARRKTISLRELSEEPYVMFEGPSSRQYFEKILHSQGIQPDIAFTGKSMESVRSAVANGFGFSLAVMATTHTETHDGGHVVSIPLTDDIDTLSVVLICKDSSSESALLENFIAFCKSRLMR
ncbi:LysR family transcriptional regulator [Granulosicoccus sp. 3-233]|uniref:LysR family transcriptional regulator n=1 Tax=Granulosicoccus sp. 3-233 TaxID=3417969 RepID=UPI003D346C4D